MGKVDSGHCHGKQVTLDGGTDFRRLGIRCKINGWLGIPRIKVRSSDSVHSRNKQENARMLKVCKEKIVQQCTQNTCDEGVWHTVCLGSDSRNLSSTRRSALQIFAIVHVDDLRRKDRITLLKMRSSILSSQHWRSGTGWLGSSRLTKSAPGKSHPFL